MGEATKSFLIHKLSYSEINTYIFLELLGHDVWGFLQTESHKALIFAFSGIVYIDPSWDHDIFLTNVKIKSDWCFLHERFSLYVPTS